MVAVVRWAAEFEFNKSSVRLQIIYFHSTVEEYISVVSEINTFTSEETKCLFVYGVIIVTFEIHNN